MNAVKEIMDYYRDIGIPVEEISKTEYISGKQKRGLVFKFPGVHSIKVYADEKMDSATFDNKCHEAMEGYISVFLGENVYSGSEVIKFSHLIVDRHDAHRDKKILCRRYLNLDVLVYMELREGLHVPLKMSEIAEDSGLDEATIWNLAYRNTENKVFLERPENWYEESDTLHFEASSEYDAVGILFKNLLWNFCNEKGVEYCFIVPESAHSMYVTIPKISKSGCLMNPEKQAKLLLSHLKADILLEEVIDIAAGQPLEPVVYIYDKLFNHIDIIAK